MCNLKLLDRLILIKIKTYGYILNYKGKEVDSKDVMLYLGMHLAVLF